MSLSYLTKISKKVFNSHQNIRKNSLRAFSFYLVIKLIYFFTFFVCKIICVNGNANKCCCCWMKFCRGQDYKNTEKLSNRDNWLKNIEITRSALEEMHFMVFTFYLKKQEPYVCEPKTLRILSEALRSRVRFNK